MEPFELPHRHEDASHLHELEEYLRRTEYFQTVALVFRQLSDANRVRLFWLLCHCEECVVNLAAMMGMSPPALSHHLRQLRESGLIVSRRDGKEVYYKAAESEQAQLLHRMIERTVARTSPPPRTFRRSTRTRSRVRTGAAPSSLRPSAASTRR